MRFAGNCRLVATIQSTLQARTAKAVDSAQEASGDLRALANFFAANTVVVKVVEAYAYDSFQALNHAIALLQDFADHRAAWEVQPPKGVLAQFGVARSFASYTHQLDQAYLAINNVLMALFAQLLEQSDRELKQLDDRFKKAESGRKKRTNRRQTVARAVEQLSNLDPSAPTPKCLWKLIAICETVHNLQRTATYPRAKIIRLRRAWTRLSGKITQQQEKVRTTRLMISEHPPEVWDDWPHEMENAVKLVVHTARTFRAHLDNELWTDAEVSCGQTEDAVGDLDSVLEIIRVRTKSISGPRHRVPRKPSARPKAPPPQHTPQPKPQPQQKPKAKITPSTAPTARKPMPAAKPASKPAALAKSADSKPAAPPVQIDKALLDKLDALSSRVGRITRAFESKGWGSVDDAKDFVAGCKQLLQDRGSTITSVQLECQLGHMETWCASLEDALAEDSMALAEQVDSIAIADGFQNAADFC